MRLSGLSGTAHRERFSLERYFPTPKLLLPRAIGIDISDSSIKWMGLSGNVVRTYGSRSLPAGIVQGGLVKDPEALGKHLREIKHETGISGAHAALPEEAAYVFGMRVPGKTTREQAFDLIEFEFEGRVPIPPSTSVYDFDVVSGRDEGDGMEIGVAVFPREVAGSYVEAFEVAGMDLLSLEIEARSIARAVSSSDANEPITLMADFGRGRTGFALIKCGIPIFTSTVSVGGDAITNVVKKELSMTDTEAEYFKNELGLAAGKEYAKAVESITATAAALADEISRHFHYWDTRRDEHGERMTPVGRVVLVGGSSNLRGLADFIASKVQAPTEHGNVWRNICSFDEYIPPIDRRASLEYATAAGLALRGN